MLFSKIPAYLIDSENVGSTWISLLQNDEKFELFICVTENAKALNFTLLKELTSDHKHKINIIECKPGKNSLDFYLSSYLGYLIGKGRHSAYVVVSQDTGYDSVIEYWNQEGYDVKRINTKPEVQKKTVQRRASRKAEEPKKEAKKETKKETRKESKPAANPNSETRVILKDESRLVKKEEEKAPAKQEKTVSKKEAPKKEEPVRKKNTEKKKVQKKENKETKEEPAKKEASLISNVLTDLLKDYPENEINDVRKYLDKVPAEKRSDKNYIYRGLVRKFKSEKGLALYTLIKKDLDRYYQTENKETA